MNISIYSPANRNKLLLLGTLLIVAIGVSDAVTPKIPVGFLYLFPVLLVAGFLSRREIIGMAAVCAALTAIFSDYGPKEALYLGFMAWTGFIGTGFFVSELVRTRQLTLQHEEQLRALVESTPLAIMIVGSDNRVLLANEAAQNLLAPTGAPIVGQPITAFFPMLGTMLAEHPAGIFRTELRCRGKRQNGDPLLAAVWVSTAATSHGPMLAAIIVDLSEELRDRGDGNLQSILTNAKILVAAMAHEVRNLCGAARLTYNKLLRLGEFRDDQDFRALGAVIEALARLSAFELNSPEPSEPAYVELSTVLDELRVIIEPVYRKAGMEIAWGLPEDRLRVRAEHYGLLQVFLNLARNSQQAMQQSERKQLAIHRSIVNGSVVVRFEDTGPGIAHPEQLFHPFQQSATSTGLGLYVSRAILKSFGAQIIHEPRPKGCSFAVILQADSNSEEPNTRFP